MNKYMELAFDSANDGIMNNEGGPFGACITDSDGNIISTGCNQVLKNNDPTAHAEINAIRSACNKLHTYNLHGCILYTTCEPCPMCLSAIIWANINTVYYGCTKKDAEAIGFRDNLIYDYFKTHNSSIIDFKEVDRIECKELFKKYKNTIY